MKKIGIFMCSLALVGMVFTSCNKEKGQDQDVDLDNIVEDGFYAVGDACPIKTVDASDAVKAQMAQGINEVLMDQDKKTWDEAKRDGMYEKFIWLEANKDFELILKEGDNTTIYGADLKKDSLNTDKGLVLGYKGSLIIGQKMKVQESGLYHIVLDLNKDGKLDLTGKEQIIVAPVNWAVTVSNNDKEASSVDVKSPTEIVWKWDAVEIKPADWFKFKDFVTGWKIVLDDANMVKAHTNLGAREDEPTKLINGTGNLPNVKKYGKYAITLTYRLNKGEVGNSFEYTVDLVEELQPAYPETMYMIGKEFGDWKWESEDVVTMAPVHSHEGMFWCTRKLTANQGFKFNSVKSWDEGNVFGKLGDSEVTTDNDGNLLVAEDGLYTIVVDLAGNMVYVKKAEIYGMGDCFGNWNVGENAFTINADGTATVTVANAGNLRIYTNIIEGIDWWQAEYNIYDGKIVYRGIGNDQEAVPVNAGAVVTLDFNAGTGSIQ